jgi:hypothetical protein
VNATDEVGVSVASETPADFRSRLLDRVRLFWQRFAGALEEKHLRGGLFNSWPH